MKKWLKRLTLLSLIAVVVYVLYLNHLVQGAFSLPTQTTEQVTQIEYSLDSYPKELINMLLLVEDQSFFQHPGVDVKEISRVFSAYFLDNKPLRGASTISQQLVKNTLLSREKTLTRKIKEAMMALLMELNYDKNFILERYMNTVYLAQDGAVAIHGFAGASEYYFDKSVEQLNLDEMAILVALLKGPSYYHPVKYPERLEKRRNLILSMHHKYKRIVQ
ncbi:MAG: transglycosylase domain-containing protein [Gammaproteobacteria bacterium]|nr:transglycosylase domain-containing protein [Gammaproteobacteria bacterium]